MKLPVCRVIVASLVMVVFLVAPAYANPIPPHFMSIVHIEKNGTPYTEKNNYSMICYGHTTKQIRGSYYLRNKTKDDPNPPQLVFDLLASQPAEFTRPCDTCYYGWYYGTDPDHCEFCQLTGTTENGPFSVWNNSDRPAVNYTKLETVPYNLYEFYFTLPLDNQTSKETIIPTVTLFNQKSPIESLYCTLQQFFGGRCE